MLEKTYNAKAVESRIAAAWEEAKVFCADSSADNKVFFSVVMPPPNITGSLHMGHALNMTLQDILARFERMRGKNVLWQPGIDHAGIATQMIVERQLADKKEPDRRTMGRERFIQRVWQWKNESGGMIIDQLRHLGASCDWSRERFTMDEELARAVVNAFVILYKQGLIYKDKRLVNWDPKLLTAISDIEVKQKEVKGYLWYFRYPLEGKVFNPKDIKTFVVVATTRPETLLGDTAIAVHREDKRYYEKIGKYAILPLVGRKLLIIGDDYVNPKAGSGAVKITPAHDFNDFEIGRRHNLPIINIFDSGASLKLVNNMEFLQGLDDSYHLDCLQTELDGVERFSARRKIVEKMEAGGYLHAIEECTHMIPHGDRGGVPIEPFLTEQWYVHAEKLAKPAIEAVRNREIMLIPKGWEKNYFDWLENIEPWCISRQLWWGHQIPAWYGPDGMIFVERNAREAEKAAALHYRREVSLVQDEDVLDTWFSSALWPFSTLGWPDKTSELAARYPTNILVTGFDILFFWVARMVMMGLHFMDAVPFRAVYVHALVRDKSGAKMSKSKGNVINPSELIAEYGADALRFSLVTMSAQGRDVKLDPTRIAGYRNFGTKLWNVTRFSKMNGVVHDKDFSPSATKLTINRWILTELSFVGQKVTKGIAAYRFNEAAATLYHFVWNSFCDWYIELIKPFFHNKNLDTNTENEVHKCMAFCLDTIYKILHPFMPYITEELWEKTADPGRQRSTMLALAPWPNLYFVDDQAAEEINWLVTLIREIRSLRAGVRIPPTVLSELIVVNADEEINQRLFLHRPALERLGRIASVAFIDKIPPLSAHITLDSVVFCIPLGKVIDLAAEKIRLMKELAKVNNEIKILDGKLSDTAFITNARQEIVKTKQERLESCQKSREKIKRELTWLVSH